MHDFFYVFFRKLLKPADKYVSRFNMLSLNTPIYELDEQFLKEIVCDGNRFFFLKVLYEGPIHGYGIMNRYRATLDRELSQSMIYPFLTLLIEKGYATANTTYTGEKERKVYKLTDSGRLFCRALFARFQEIFAVAMDEQ